MSIPTVVFNTDGSSLQTWTVTESHASSRRGCYQIDSSKTPTVSCEWENPNRRDRLLKRRLSAYRSCFGKSGSCLPAGPKGRQRPGVAGSWLLRSEEVVYFQPSAGTCLHRVFECPEDQSTRRITFSGSKAQHKEITGTTVGRILTSMWSFAALVLLVPVLRLSFLEFVEFGLPACS